MEALSRILSEFPDMNWQRRLLVTSFWEQKVKCLIFPADHVLSSQGQPLSKLTGALQAYLLPTFPSPNSQIIIKGELDVSELLREGGVFKDGSSPLYISGDEGRSFADPPPTATNVPEYLGRRLWWDGQEGRVKGSLQVQSRKTMAPTYGPRLLRWAGGG